MSGFSPTLSQVAFSVVDLRRTETWFREGLGFLPAGGAMALMSGPIATRVQGLPGAASCAWWLVGRNAWFQLELFQFRRPVAKLMPAGFRPCDIGYTRIGVHVANFDATLQRLSTHGSEPLAPVQGEFGQRRACVRNPDGVYVEILEEDPLPQAVGSEREGCPVAVRSVTMSTPDLEQSVAYFTALCGHGPEEIALHTAQDEALWNLAGAECRRAVFRAGDILVEVVEYQDPVGRPWPSGYRICDQGILNIALGARSAVDHARVVARAKDFGARPNWKTFTLPMAGVVYFGDDLGFSVEVLWLQPGWADRRFGFEPLPIDRRPEPANQSVRAKIVTSASVADVWAALCDHEAMSSWAGFDRVTVIHSGDPDRNGVGAQRLMSGSPGTVIEQIVGAQSERCLRYRVIEGAPFHFHRGEIRLRGNGDGTEVEWEIGFRAKVPMTGPLVRMAMQPLLRRILECGFVPYVEGRSTRRQKALDPTNATLGANV